ncbi:hypothetical protein [Coleofasciculus sp. G2-EDA-02]|uniref:hypothetical protein n=1 Tax=Coleofasciculus sp. G2-EDA-02 TaxID=3069529 RepID=UPI0032F63499
MERLYPTKIEHHSQRNPEQMSVNVIAEVLTLNNSRVRMDSGKLRHEIFKLHDLNSIF